MAGITTLVLRAAPRGREALAYALLFAIPGFLGPVLLLPLVIGLTWALTVLAAIAISVLAAAAVSLLPRSIREGRDGVPSS
jgi:hypothetical protein